MTSWHATMFAHSASLPDEPCGDVHVYPLDCEPPHITSRRCWCMPEIEHVAEDGTRVWLHRELQ